MNSQKVLGLLVLIIIVIGLGVLLVKHNSPSSASPTPTPTTSATTGSPTPSSSSTSESITITNFSFSNPNLIVKVGDTVTWTNQDSVAHTVTSTNGGPLNSSEVTPGKTYSFTFTKAGTYPYHCTIHPDMTGTVIVQ